MLASRVDLSSRSGSGWQRRASPWFTTVSPPLTTIAAEAGEPVSILDAAITAAEASLGRGPAGAR